MRNRKRLIGAAIATAALTVLAPPTAHLASYSYIDRAYANVQPHMSPDTVASNWRLLKVTRVPISDIEGHYADDLCLRPGDEVIRFSLPLTGDAFHVVYDRRGQIVRKIPTYD